jgi:hypothetical protein
MLNQRHAKEQDVVIIRAIIMCVCLQGEATRIVMKAYNRRDSLWWRPINSNSSFVTASLCSKNILHTYMTFHSSTSPFTPPEFHLPEHVSPLHSLRIITAASVLSHHSLGWDYIPTDTGFEERSNLTIPAWLRSKHKAHKSTSELYRLNDQELLTNFSANFCG